MPHIHSVIRPRAYGLLGETFGSQFLPSLAGVVSEQFIQRTGETMAVGRDCLAYEPVIDLTAPVDLAVVVVVWWKPHRALHFGDIELALQSAIARLDRRFTTEVKLNIFGEPTIEDFFAGDEYLKVRNRLMGSSIIKIGQLLSRSPDDLMSITHFNQHCLEQVVARLGIMGLSLRSASPH